MLVPTESQPEDEKPRLPAPKKKKKSLPTRQIQAAILVAEDKLTNEKIGDRVGVSKRAIEKWKKRPEFAEEVERQKDIWRKRVENSRFALRHRRIEALDDLAARQMFVMQDRATRATVATIPPGEEGHEPEKYDPELAAVPGIRSGLIVRTRRSRVTTKNGETFTEDAQYEVDNGLSAEFRATLRQISEEKGELVHKGELTGKDGAPLLSIEMFRQLIVIANGGD